MGPHWQPMLATVSLDKSDAPKTSELLIDGKRLVIYRCDYTIDDRELLE